MTNEEILNKINGGLIVSCQALESEPLYDSYIMSKMAWAAKLGGAVGIRANTVVDIKAIKEKVDLPIIGIIKQEYDDSDVYITPTMAEVDALVEVGCEIIAIDATNRLRPNGITLESFFKEVRKKYPNQLFMADTSAFDDNYNRFRCVSDRDKKVLLRNGHDMNRFVTLIILLTRFNGIIQKV